MPEVSPALRWRRLWLLLAWSLCAMVMGLSLMPNPPALPEVRFSDKVGHLLAYGSLMFCFGQLYAHRWLVALLLALLGGAVEFLQQLTGRWFELTDMLANTLGVVGAWALLHFTPLGRALAWLESRTATAEQR